MTFYHPTAAAIESTSLQNGHPSTDYLKSSKKYDKLMEKLPTNTAMRDEFFIDDLLYAHEERFA